MDFSYLKTCESITEDVFRLAIATKEQTEAFLRHIEDISKPATGVGKILFFFARLALRNSELEGSGNFVYEDLALQVTQSRRNPTLYEIRYMNDVGGSYEQIYKVTVWCTFTELLNAAQDKKNITPFTCEDGRENYLLLKATADKIKTSIPPPEYVDADARYQELLSAGMLSAGSRVSYGENGNRNGRLRTQPFPPQASEIPGELTHATVLGALPPARKKYESLADEAYDLAQQPPSIPSGPIPGEDSVRSRQGEAIARLSLVKVSKGFANQPVQRQKPPSTSPLRYRQETERPPGIEEAEGEDIDVDDGWGDVKLPIVYGKRKDDE